MNTEMVVGTAIPRAYWWNCNIIVNMIISDKYNIMELNRARERDT